LDSGLSIKERGLLVRQEVSGNNLILSVSHVSLHEFISHLLDLGANLLEAFFLGRTNSEINNRDIRYWDKEGHSGQLAVQLGSIQNYFKNKLLTYTR
jgi:hypothetical protein